MSVNIVSHTCKIYDDNGRTVLPSGIRQVLDAEKGDTITYSVEIVNGNKTVVLEKNDE